MFWDIEKGIRALSKNDSKFGRLIKKCPQPDFLVKPTVSPFHALAKSIIYQQLTAKSAQAIYTKVLLTTEQLEPELVTKLEDEQLRAAGLSRNKMLALQDLARFQQQGLLGGWKDLQEQDSQSIIDSLVTVRGIGPWTAQIFVLFNLHNPDILPIDDLGLKKGMMRLDKLAKLPTAKELFHRGQQWKPWRSLASWYLWRILELDDNELT